MNKPNDAAEPSLASAGSVDELGPVPPATDTGIRLSLLRWIPVSESLPYRGEMVLVWSNSNGLHRASLDSNGQWLDEYENPGKKITHWMRTPAPPQTDE